MPDNPLRRRVVFVAGSGRSGTSTVSGALKALGLYVPQPEVAADPTNPKGFAEPAWAIEFHDRLLDRALVAVSDARPEAWDATHQIAARPRPNADLHAWLGEQLASSPAPELVIKDPRLTWFLPMWLRTTTALSATPTVLTMLRPPAEVVGSKRQNYDSSMDPGSVLAGWLNLLLGTERHSRGAQRAFVRYHDLLTQWGPSLDHAADLLGLQMVGDAREDARASVSTFVDPSLRRATVGLEELDVPERLRNLAAEAWGALQLLVDDPNHTTATNGLDDVGRRYASMYNDAARIARSSQVAAHRRGIRRERRRGQQTRPPA